MKIIGLTGGIASGKSTVASHWRQRGVAVIDADLVARDVVEPGQPALAAIVDHFGAGVLTAEGALDRPKLGAIVFTDRAELAALNRITHPAILKQVAATVAAFRQQRHPWIAYEAALIVENKLSPGLAELVVVLCDIDTQHRRLMARNHLDADAAWARIRSQATNEQRRAAADVVIDNNSSLDNLLAAADAVADSYDVRFSS